MKKTIFLGCMGLLFGLMALVSYAAMTKESLSPNNASDLKGKWEGWRTGPVGGSKNLRTELEIYNDTLPLKGKLTAHDVKRKGVLSGTETNDFNQGTINNDGNFYLKWGQNYLELSLYKGDGKMKLEGDCYFTGAKGTITLHKK